MRQVRVWPSKVKQRQNLLSAELKTPPQIVCRLHPITNRCSTAPRSDRTALLLHPLGSALRRQPSSVGALKRSVARPLHLQKKIIKQELRSSPAMTCCSQHRTSSSRRRTSTACRFSSFCRRSNSKSNVVKPVGRVRVRRRTVPPIQPSTHQLWRRPKAPLFSRAPAQTPEPPLQHACCSFPAAAALLQEAGCVGAGKGFIDFDVKRPPLLVPT